MTLSEFATQFIAGRTISPVYAGTLKRRAVALERFATCREMDRLATIGQSLPDGYKLPIGMALNEPIVNEFLSLIEGSPYTRKSYRGDVLLLWRNAADDGLVPYPVTRKVRREKMPELVVECFSHDEARELIAAARSLRGGLPSGVGRKHYWEAIIRAGWDSGLRRGDLWRLRRDCIRPDGSAVVVQHKTGKLAAVRFRESTIKCLEAIGGTIPLGWPLNTWSFGEGFQRIVKAAGVRGGTFRWLRRASGSYVEASLPGSGHKQLGHASAVVFDKHYDARLAGANWPQPPEL